MVAPRSDDWAIASISRSKFFLGSPAETETRPVRSTGLSGMTTFGPTVGSKVTTPPGSSEPLCGWASTPAVSYTHLDVYKRQALCAPTRAALLTGRNHHTVGMGTITETATSAPGYTSIRPKSTAPLAEILKQNGYSTAQFGKCHEVPVWKTSPVGPFDLWPTGSGFDYFYGFIGGETNQYYPCLLYTSRCV